jgi:hypothetical protein
MFPPFYHFSFWKTRFSAISSATHFSIALPFPYKKEIQNVLPNKNSIQKKGA